MKGLSQSIKNKNLRKTVRVLTRIEANVGSTFMSNCILQLHLGSACLEILVIRNEKLSFLKKEDVD